MYRKNVTGQHLGFVLINASTGVALTGATVVAHTSIDGAAQAVATGTTTEKGLGQYSFALSQADTNGNQISYLFTATSAVPVEKTIVTTACDPTNAASFGITDIDAQISTRSTYAGGDTSGTTTLLTRLPGMIAANGSGFTALGDARIANLDVQVSTRSVYGGGDTAGTTTLLSRVTGAVALATQIPANFTTATFASAGVFSTGALANAPAGGGGGGALPSNGLDSISIESGVNARQALSLILAACGGIVSGAGTGTVVIKGGNVSTTRITASTDNAGNRSSVTLTIPT